jgi:sarcosine oxidase
MKRDIIILGLGAMGTAAAYHLARRGARVLGIEQFGLAHDRGSSHGRTRIIRQAYHEAPEYVPLVLRAYELWRALEQEGRVPLLSTTGALYVASPHSALIEGVLLSARTHGITLDTLAPAEIERRYPVIHPPAGSVGLVEHDAGILVPEDCITAHATLARQHGAELHFGESVTSWDAAPGRVSVRTAAGTYEAGRLVITTGPWTGEVLNGLGLPLEVERAVLFWFEPRARRESFERLPVYIWEDEGASAYGFPYIEGQGLKCAFHHSFGERTTPGTIRRVVGEAERARMQEYLARFMPDAAGRLLAATTCMYTNTPDGHFIVDHHPGHRNVVLACGFSGHGFKFSSVIGETLADLALDGGTSHPIGFLSLRRFGSFVA